MKKTLIVGLGNPGEEYEGAPHNAGFEVIDLLEKMDLLKKAVLIKPDVFVNKSGGSVLKAKEEHKVKDTKDIWIVHDDIDLPIGTVRKSVNRGAAGHKGVESIIRALKTKDFTRYRVGIHIPAMKAGKRQDKMRDFVTKPYTGERAKTFKKALKNAAKMIVEDLS